jgi:hypothetical protein
VPDSTFDGHSPALPCPGATSLLLPAAGAFAKTLPNIRMLIVFPRCIRPRLFNLKGITMGSLLTFAVAVFVGVEPVAPPPAPFTPARFREHVAFLASDELAGRAVGSPGLKKAADYLIGHLKEYGVTSLREGGDWIQSFPFATEVTAAPECTLTSNEGPPFALGRDFTIVPASPDGQWEAGVVFVGHAISAPRQGYDDFAGVDLQGKVAVFLAGISKALGDAGLFATREERWLECERRGALAVIEIQPGDRSRLATKRQVHDAGPPRRVPCLLITREAAGRVFPTTKADTLAAVEEALTSAGKPKPQARPLPGKLRLRVRLERTRVPGANVLGIRTGKGELDRQAILVSTHHDHLARTRSASRPARTASTTAPMTTLPAAPLYSCWPRPCTPIGTSYPRPAGASSSLPLTPKNKG